MEFICGNNSCPIVSNKTHGIRYAYLNSGKTLAWEVPYSKYIQTDRQTADPVEVIKSKEALLNRELSEAWSGEYNQSTLRHKNIIL